MLDSVIDLYPHYRGTISSVRYMNQVQPTVLWLKQEGVGVYIAEGLSDHIDVASFLCADGLRTLVMKVIGSSTP